MSRFTIDLRFLNGLKYFVKLLSKIILIFHNFFYHVFLLRKYLKP